MAEAYEELYDEEIQEYNFFKKKYKYQNREKKRHKSLEALDKKNNKKTRSANVNSKKTVFTVKVLAYDAEYSFDIPASKYGFRPEGFKEIKEICIEKYGSEVQIININTK